jgi:hypothetical protein
MARQPMPKALSPLQSDQRSYTSEFSVVSWSCWSCWICWRVSSWVEWSELVSKEGREPGVRRLPGLQRLRWLRNGCDIFSRELWDWGSPERLSCVVLECTIVMNPIVNPIPVYGHLTRDNIILYTLQPSEFIPIILQVGVSVVASVRDVTISVATPTILTQVSRSDGLLTRRPGLVFGRGKKFVSTPQRPDRLWSSPSLLFNGYRGLFTRGEAAGAWS